MHGHITYNILCMIVNHLHSKSRDKDANVTVFVSRDVANVRAKSLTIHGETAIDTR